MMNKFYDIAVDGEERLPFQLRNLGKQTHLATVGGGRRNDWGEDSSWSKTYYRDTTEEDYDNQFAYEITKSKPAHDAFNLLNHHFQNFLARNPNDTELFLKQIKYVIRPILMKNSNGQVFGQIVDEWLNSHKKTKRSMLDGIDVAGDMKDGLNEMFEIMACKIKLHKNFNCSNSSFTEMKSMPNKPKNSNQDVFQFQSKIDVEKGDVIEKLVSGEFYMVEKTENHTMGDSFLFMWAYVKRIDSKGNYIN